MKRNKVMLIIQMILMYLAHLPFYIGLILIRVPNSEAYDDIIIRLFLIGFMLTIVILPFCLANLIMALAGVLNKKDNPCKTTMIVKILLIPWYIMNFLFCDLLLIGFLNPWLMLFMPVVLCVLIFNTYLFMISTSIFDIVYAIRKAIKKELPVKASLIFTILFLFSFCLDVIGSIMLYIKSKKIESTWHQ